ncbi:MAG: hypothetical protein R3C44_21900 [Chloroflexota bacterium]
MSPRLPLWLTPGETPAEPVMDDGSATATVNVAGLPVQAHVQVIPATPYDNAQSISPVGLPEHFQIELVRDDQPDGTPAL